MAISTSMVQEADAPVTNAYKGTRVDNGPMMRFVLTLSVVGPIVGLVFALVQLWHRAVLGIDLALLGGMYFMAAMGITVGFHRYLTHRGFKANGWLKFALLAMGSMALEGPAITWASTHLEHHARSDKEGDPHSPVEGFFHAHVGWIIDGFIPNPTKYGDWLLKDKIVVFVNRTFWVWVILGFAIPFALDGWRGVLWGGVVRVVLVHHVTWSVNSVCHVFGQRPFKTGDESRNNWLVGLLAGGEGWHNNHHAFQRNAFHGLYWWQFDLAGLFIRSLETLRLITDVQRVNPQTLLRRRLDARRGESTEVAASPAS